MALSSAIEGAKRPSQLITWSDLDLTGATITATIEPTNGTASASDGTFTLTDSSNGIFRWDYSTADVATAGTYLVEFTATFAGNPTPAKSISEFWEVLDSLS